VEGQTEEKKEDDSILKVQVTKKARIDVDSARKEKRRLVKYHDLDCSSYFGFFRLE